MAAQPRVPNVILFVTVCLFPGVFSWSFPWTSSSSHSATLNLTANPPHFVTGSNQDVVLKCEVTPHTDLSQIRGLLIQKFNNSGFFHNVARSTVSSTGANGASVILPANDASSHVGDYRCVYIMAAPFPYEIPHVNITEKASSADVSMLNDTVIALQELVSMLESNLTAITQRINTEIPPTQWPTGIYALLKPESGCPNDPAFRNQLTSWVSFDLENTPNGDFNAAFFRTHLSTPVFTTISQASGNTMAYMRFCPTDNSNSAIPWPTGAYCLARGGSSCPLFFSPGSLFITSENGDPGPFESNGGPGTRPNFIDFCCRNDGPTSTPISLPTSSPFYLFMVGGACQQVSGMTVSREVVDFDTENTGNGDAISGATPLTRILAGGRVFLSFCYYTPT